MSLNSTVVMSVAALAIGAGSGWQINGWRWEAKFADMQTATIQVYETKQKELNLKFAEQLERDTTARAALSQSLQQSRAKAGELEKELETLQLSPSQPEIVVERVVETITEVVDGECKATEMVLANPFTDDFVRLWNESANSAIARSPTPP